MTDQVLQLEKAPANLFALFDEHAIMGKIGNNLEKHGDTDEMLGWTLPMTLMLPAEQLDRVKGAYFHRSLYNVNKNPWEVVEGFKDCAPLEDERTFEGVKALLRFAIADKELEFEGCRVTKIFYEATHGGLTKTWFHLYVHPEIGEETSLLLEHQNSEVSVRLSDGKLALKKNPKQQSLPLGAPKGQQSAPQVEGEGGEPNSPQPEASAEVIGADAHPDPDALNGDPAEDLARFEEGAKAEAERFKARATRGVIDGRTGHFTQDTPGDEAA